MRLAQRGGPRELYDVLEVEQTATLDIIKRAYYKLALAHHPDRSTSPNSKEMFQKVGQAYETLSNPVHRKVYDETGVIEGGNEEEANWMSYFRELFQRVTFADLDAFKATYIGSVEEYEDILMAYIKYRGDISKISEAIFFGDVESESRYMEIITRAINKGIITKYECFKKIVSDEAAYRAEQRKRKRRAEREATEAVKLAKELGLNAGKDGLSTIISQRQKDRFETFIANLESKYSTTTRRNGTKKGSKK